MSARKDELAAAVQAGHHTQRAICIGELKGADVFLSDIELQRLGLERHKGDMLALEIKRRLIDALENTGSRTIQEHIS